MKASYALVLGMTLDRAIGLGPRVLFQVEVSWLLMFRGCGILRQHMYKFANKYFQ